MSKPEVLFVGSGPDWYLERYERDFHLEMLPLGDPALLKPVAG